MSNPFFSIIIPVYNVEAYLAQCVKSVLSQTFQDFEIILIDDGSIDSSTKMCDRYSKLDTRIYSIQKENGGASSARNVGIRCARGEYLLFLDSDDYWDNENVLKDIYDTILQFQIDIDIVSFSSKWLMKNGTLLDDGFNFQISCLIAGTCDELEYQLQHNLIVGSVCSKAIRKDFILKNRLFFLEGVRCEDIDWIIRACCMLPRHAFLNKHVYVYRKEREGSVTATVNENHIQQYLSIIVDFCEKERYCSNPAFELMTNYVAFHYMIVLGYISNCPNTSEKKQLIQATKKLSWLFSYDLHPKVRLMGKVYRVLGFYATSLLLGCYIKIRNKRII